MRGTGFKRCGLGHDLVIQTAFGDSGHTTFFIASENDFNKHKDEIIHDPEVKIMKRINCRGATRVAPRQLMRFMILTSGS
ncbi:hypothetical protein ACW7EJ_16485 [Acinetobacter soli]